MCESPPSREFGELPKVRNQFALADPWNADVAVRWRPLRWTHELGRFLVGRGSTQNAAVTGARASAIARKRHLAVPRNTDSSRRSMAERAVLPDGAQTSDTRCRSTVTAPIRLSIAVVTAASPYQHRNLRHDVRTDRLPYRARNAPRKPGLGAHANASECLSSYLNHGLLARVSNVKDLELKPFHALHTDSPSAPEQLRQQCRLGSLRLAPRVLPRLAALPDR